MIVCSSAFNFGKIQIWYDSAVHYEFLRLTNREAFDQLLVNKECGRQAAAPGADTVVEKSSNIERVSVSNKISIVQWLACQNPDVVLAFPSQHSDRWG